MELATRRLPEGEDYVFPGDRRTEPAAEEPTASLPGQSPRPGTC
jgi:hypothetical protein